MSSQTPSTRVLLDAASLLDKKFCYGWARDGEVVYNSLSEALSQRKRLTGFCAITALHIAALNIVPDRKSAGKLANSAFIRLAAHIGVKRSWPAVYSWNDDADKKTVVSAFREAAMA